jgi:radical SAM protein with 4Fe4S-binding SPASM domain
MLIPEVQAHKMEYNSLNSTLCKDCKLTPLCKGGCHLLRAMNRNPCIAEKYFIDEYIKILYLEQVQLNN